MRHKGLRTTWAWIPHAWAHSLSRSVAPVAAGAIVALVWVSMRRTIVVHLPLLPGAVLLGILRIVVPLIAALISRCVVVVAAAAVLLDSALRTGTSTAVVLCRRLYLHIGHCVMQLSVVVMMMMLMMMLKVTMMTMLRREFQPFQWSANSAIVC